MLGTLFSDYMETSLWSRSPELLWEKAGGSKLSGEVENGEVTHKVKGGFRKPKTYSLST